MSERKQILRYARHHNLISSNPNQHEHDALLECFATGDQSISHDGLVGLPTLETLGLADDTIERLDLSADAREFLHTVLVTEAAFTDIDWRLHCGDHRQRLKLEPPLLITDHELDVRMFRKGAGVDVPVKESFSPVALDAENDAELARLAEIESSWNACNSQSTNEKLDVTCNAMMLLKEVLSPEDPQQSLDEAFRLELRHKRGHMHYNLTPPLSPSPETPGNSSFLEVAPISSPLPDVSPFQSGRLPTSEELAELREDYFHSEQISPTPGASLLIPGQGEIASNDECPSSVANWDIETNSPTLVMRAKCRHLEVDEPLFPAFSSLKSPETVTFSDALEDMPVILPTSYADDGLHHSDAESELDRIFDFVIETEAVRADNGLNNEQLREAGIDTRIPLRRVDVSRPAAPWSRELDEVQAAKEVCELTVPISKLSLHRWPGLAKYDAGPKALPWSPFPMRLAEISEFEALGCADDVAGFLDVTGYDTAISPTDLTWKPDGLRILDMDEDIDDEALQPEQTERHAGFQVLLRKRKATSQNEQSRSHEPRPPRGQISSNGTRSSQTPVDTSPELLELSQSDSQFATPETKPEHTFVHARKNVPSLFDAQESLSRFMEMHGHKPKKPRLSLKNSQPVPAQAASQQQQYEPQNTEIFRPPQASLPRYAAPAFTDQLENLNIIISSSLMRTHRLLIRHVTTLQPTLTFVERDWTARKGLMLGSQTPQKASCLTQSHNHNMDPDLDHDEGDIQVSPTTCILITTVQMIKQKPLPGQSSESRLHCRIRAVANRFETLVVLVSLGCGNSSAHKLDAVDFAALSSLMGFCAGLQDDEVVVYPVAGGDDDLARWIVGLAAQTGCGKGLNLLEVETMWELSLRRAGANAFAAQVILAGLKQPENEDENRSDPAALDPSSARLFGLPAFVAMDAGQRLSLFQGVLGGSKVLKRLARLIDAEWRMVDGAMLEQGRGQRDP